MALAPDDGVRLLQHQDGSWGLVGDDGWEIDSEALHEVHADTLRALAAASVKPVVCLAYEAVSLGAVPVAKWRR